LPGGRPPNCLICKNDALKAYLNDNLNRGLSNAGISAGLAAAGGSLDPDVIGRHKSRHWTRPTDPDAPKATKRDLAIMVHEKAVEGLEGVSGEGMLLMGKELAPAINAGLKARAILDKREQAQAKLGLAAGALSLQMWLAGLSEAPPPPELDDGHTIEGTAVDVTDEA
jgi:hypothetical protein